MFGGWVRWVRRGRVWDRGGVLGVTTEKVSGLESGTTDETHSKMIIKKRANVGEKVLSCLKIPCNNTYIWMDYIEMKHRQQYHPHS